MSGGLIIELRLTDKNSKLVSFASDHQKGASFFAPNRLSLIMAASLPAIYRFGTHAVDVLSCINSNDDNVDHRSFLRTGR